MVPLGVRTTGVDRILEVLHNHVQEPPTSAQIGSVLPESGSRGENRRSRTSGCDGAASQQEVVSEPSELLLDPKPQIYDQFKPVGSDSGTSRS